MREGGATFAEGVGCFAGLAGIGVAEGAADDVALGAATDGTAVDATGVT